MDKIFSLDHKVIGRQFLWYSLFFFFVGGFLAFLIRWQLAYPGAPVPLVGEMLFPGTAGAMTPDHYNVAVTMHGTVMVFFAITPLLIGAFGNFLIPLQIGARDMAFPTLNMLSFWFMVPAGLVLMASFAVEGGAAAAGWTAYPPLSSVGSPGLGQTLWILSLALAGTSSIMGAVNYITTIVAMRAPGMTWMRLPLTTWGLFYTAVLNAIYVPVIASGLVMLLLDRTVGTAFFTAGPLAVSRGFAPGGQALLYQHVFWVFGHPEVYILILPAWGMVGCMLSHFSRKPAFGYRNTVIAMGTISALSTMVWAHHMFTSGMNPFVGRIFAFTTFLVSIPSSVLFLNWLGTLWGGAIRITAPSVFAIGVIYVFGLGGLTGMFNASQGIDVYIHDTYVVVGHFHFTLAASVLFAGFAAVYFWFPKIYGRKMHDGLGIAHFVITAIALTVVFGGMMQIGALGHMRRVSEPSAYAFLKPLQKDNILISHGAFTLFASQILFVANLVWSYFKGEPAGENPWDCSTLEWTTPSPPPHENFEAIPVVRRNPYQYSHPGLTDRDWISQADPAPIALDGGA